MEKADAWFETLAPLTLEAPDHAVHDAFIRRSVRARYLGCAPREAASRRMNTKQFRCLAISSPALARVARSRRHAICARHLVLAAQQHIASGSRHFGQKALISPASQVGRHRAMAGLSTMTHATMNATHATSILVPPPLPRLEKKAVPQKWGKYDEFVSCARRCGGIGVRRRFADTRIALVAKSCPQDKETCAAKRRRFVFQAVSMESMSLMKLRRRQISDCSRHTQRRSDGQR